MRDKIIEIAQAEVGYKEKPAGSNINKYGEWFGKNGVAWCGAFVSWVYFQAGYKWPKNMDSPKGIIWVPIVLIRARQFPQFYKRTFEPNPGDLIIFDWNADKKEDHIGIFLNWIIKDKTFATIEGNTARGNDSNGGQVQQRERKIEHVVSFVNVID
jgi:hypothetical protein